MANPVPGRDLPVPGVPAIELTAKGIHKQRMDDVVTEVMSFKVEDGYLAEAGCYRFQVIDRSQVRFLTSELQPFEVICPLDLVLTCYTVATS